MFSYFFFLSNLKKTRISRLKWPISTRNYRTDVDYQGKEKEAEENAWTDIMWKTKGKLHSPSNHFFLIVLVARSGWPFMCVCNSCSVLLTLSFFLFIFNHADGRWQWWSNPYRLNQHESNEKSTKEKWMIRPTQAKKDRERNIKSN